MKNEACPSTVSGEEVPFWKPSFSDSMLVFWGRGPQAGTSLFMKIHPLLGNKLRSQSSDILPAKMRACVLVAKITTGEIEFSG